MFWNLSSEQMKFLFNRSHEEYFSGTELVKYYAVDIKICFQGILGMHRHILVLKGNVNL